jgi:integrase
MLFLLKELMTKKELTESTATLYIKNLYALNNKQPFLNLSFLKDYEGIEKYLNDYSDNTKKTLLSGLTSVLSLYKDKPSYKKVYEHYFNKMMAKANEMKEVNDNKMTDKESENWITWDEIIEIKKKLKEIVDNLFQNNKLLTPKQYDLILSYLILSLYTDQPPRRNLDYMNMYVVSTAKDQDLNKNYLDWTNKKFIFNNYKTAKTYGSQIVDITPELIETLKIYLSFHPLNTHQKLKFPKNTEFKFLVYNDGSGLSSVNSITRILNKIFNGKKIGSSMIRHIYLSSKYDIDAMQKDAEEMGHSIEEQKKYMKSQSQSNVV